MSILEISAKACQPTSPSSVIAWSPDEAAAGQARALLFLGLVDKIKYSASVSGGSWFHTLWQFWSSGASDEAQLLGPYVPPRALNESFLRAMPGGCCLGAPGRESLWRLLARLLVRSRLDPAYSLDRAW